MSNQYSGTSEELFWKLVEKTNSCWNWIGCKNQKGYGRLNRKGIKYSAHRYSWLITFGEIPTELFVCHSCDNRLCVNPSHLWLGSAKDNKQDCLNKNRQGKGFKHRRIENEEQLQTHHQAT